MDVRASVPRTHRWPQQSAKAAKPSRRRTQHDHTVLVLQGGGSLGAYQAGAYEGLAEAGLAPDWVTGVSIGAINAALIAGNPPGTARRAAAHVLGSRLGRSAAHPAARARPAAPRVQPHQRVRRGRLRHQRLLHAARAAALFRRTGQPRRPQLLRYRAAEAHARRARRFRSHQQPLDAAVGGRRQGANRRLGVLRQSPSAHHDRAHPRERRAAARFSADHDRGRRILGRGHRVELPALVRARRFAAIERADRPGRPLQRQRRASRQPRTRCSSGRRTSSTRARRASTPSASRS